MAKLENITKMADVAVSREDYGNPIRLCFHNALHDFGDDAFPAFRDAVSESMKKRGMIHGFELVIDNSYDKERNPQRDMPLIHIKNHNK